MGLDNDVFVDEIPLHVVGAIVSDVEVGWSVFLGKEVDKGIGFAVIFRLIIH